MNEADFIWMNGEMIPWDAARTHVTAHGLHYGTGVFEGMRSYDTPDGPAIFRLDAHMRRFRASASFYEIGIPFSIEELSNASLDVIRTNRLENAYLRPLAFFDSKSFNIWPKDCPVSVAIIAVLERAGPGEIYNAVDDEPVTQLRLFQWLSDRLGKPLPPSVPEPAASERNRGLSDKKVSNRKLKLELGYQLKYPTFREGFLTANLIPPETKSSQ